jgi:hypothetical protein
MIQRLFRKARKSTQSLDLKHNTIDGSRQKIRANEDRTTQQRNHNVNGSVGQFQVSTRNIPSLIIRFGRNSRTKTTMGWPKNDQHIVPGNASEIVLDGAARRSKKHLKRTCARFTYRAILPTRTN